MDLIFGLAEGLIPLLLPVPFLLHGAHQGRKLMAASPGLFGAAVYIATVLASYLSKPPVSDSVLLLHLLASAIPLLLLVPSVMALRIKWLSIVHLITLAGVAWSCLIGYVLIAGTS